jgi:hypothetical protein
LAASGRSGRRKIQGVKSAERMITNGTQADEKEGDIIT